MDGACTASADDRALGLFRIVSLSGQQYVARAHERKRGSQDALGRMKAQYHENPEPTYATLGPRDADEWRRFVDLHGVGPG